MKRTTILILILIMTFTVTIPGFSEVGSTGDSMQAVKTHGELLKDLGIIKGSGGGLGEDKDITRQEMVTIINRLSPSKIDIPIPDEPTFTDVPKTHWAYNDIELAYAKGLTNGISKTEFGIDQKINANQASLLLVRTLGVNTNGIDYSTASQKIKELSGLGLDRNVDGSEILKRGDIFNLMTQTLTSTVIDTGDIKVSELNYDESLVDEFLINSKVAVNFENTLIEEQPEANSEVNTSEYTIDLYGSLDRSFTVADIDSMSNGDEWLQDVLHEVLTQQDPQYKSFVDTYLSSDYTVEPLSKLKDFEDLRLRYKDIYVYKLDDPEYDKWLLDQGYSYHAMVDYVTVNIDSEELKYTNNLEGSEGYGLSFGLLNEVRKYKSIDGQEVYMIITTPADANHENPVKAQEFIAFTLDGSNITTVVYGSSLSNGFRVYE